MAQKRFWNWKDDDATLALSNWIRGFLPYGVYYGFDADLSIPGLNLNLVHTTRGTDLVDDTLTLQQNLGVVITKQGVLVREDAAIVLPISAGHATLGRIDLVIVEHDYQQIVGGTQAIYSVIEGTPAATPVAPALTDPNKQVIIGELFVPAAMTSMDEAGITWTVGTVSVFTADPSIMRTNLAQVSTQSKTFNHLKGILNPATIAGTAINLATLGNYYYIPYGTPNRKEIESITGQTNSLSNFIHVLTKQRLVLRSADTSGAFIGPNAYYSIGSVDMEDIYIEAGESFHLIRIDGLLGTPSVPIWYVLKGGEAGKGSAPKMKTTIRQNKGTGEVVDATGKLTLNLKGNLYEINSSSPNQLKWINSFSEYDLGGITGEQYLEAGTQIILKNIGPAITVISSATPPANYKAIFTPGFASVTFETGAYMKLVEDENGFYITSYISSTVNPFAPYLDDNLDVDLSGGVVGDEVLFYDGAMWIATNLEEKIANVRHDFTALQVWGYDVVPSSQVDDSLGIVYVNFTGNNFDIDMKEDCVITDFKMRTGGGPFSGVAYPAGTLLTVRINSTTGIAPMAVAVGPSSNIKDFRDLNTNHAFTLSVNDTLQLFKGSAYWYIVSMNGEVMRRLEAAESDISNAIADIAALDAALTPLINRQLYSAVGKATAEGGTGDTGVLKFATIVDNPSSWYNGTTGKWTPLAAGWYDLDVSANMNIGVISGYEVVQISIYKNGSAVHVLDTVGPLVNNQAANCHGVYRVQANGTTDYFEIRYALSTPHTWNMVGTVRWKFARP